MRWFILRKSDGDCEHPGKAVIFPYRARPSSQKQKDHFDKFIDLPQRTTEEPFSRAENWTLPHKVDCTWRSSEEEILTSHFY